MVDEYVEEANSGGVRTVYLMVRDINGQVGVDWGIDWGLEDNESLPNDVEELSDAQYTVWQCIKAIRGVGEEGYQKELERQAKDQPSGIIVPTKLN